MLWLTQRESQWQQLRQSCRAKYAAGSEDFLHGWLDLPEERPRQDSAGITRTIEETRKEQHERFIADFDKLDSLETRLYPVARMLYGDNWQQKLLQYNKRHDMEKTFFAGAVICCSIGGVLVLSSLVGIAVTRLKKGKPDAGLHMQPEDKKAQDEAEDNGKNSPSQKNEEPKRTVLAEILNCHKYSNEEVHESCDSIGEQTGLDTVDGKNVTADSPAKNLYTDSGSLEPDGHNRRVHVKLAELLGGKHKDADHSKFTDKSFFSSYKSIKQTRSDIDRGAKKFNKEIKQAKRISEREPDLLNETLSRLTNEVAAIRNYAGQQEEKVKKFQEGYDWNIIRNFALRVIRCIDNLERKINVLAGQGRETDYLKEVRDELLFALDSTGLERFEPQINSEYRGQEKAVEAVKEKASADNGELKGKIADIVRCGYRFVVGEGNFKVVRAAQVRLFG